MGASVALLPGSVFAGAPAASVDGRARAGVMHRAVLNDGDRDGRLDIDDNCAGIANPAQENHDGEPRPVAGRAYEDATAPNGDGAGDACDSDDDNDGLSDAAEQSSPCATATGPTSPLVLDTDSDGVGDAAECLLGSNPANSASTPTAGREDGDHDGLPDAAEGAIGTSASMADTDGDGVLDGVEVRAWATDPLRRDSDGDGCGDAREVASVNEDRTVSAIDLSQAAQAFGRRGTATYLTEFDANGDGAVNAIDLGFVARQFGAGYAPSPPPPVLRHGAQIAPRMRIIGRKTPGSDAPAPTANSSITSAAPAMTAISGLRWAQR